jgi:PKD repeat protein
LCLFSGLLQIFDFPLGIHKAEAAPINVSIIGSWVSGTTHTAESGTNRVLIFTAHTESSASGTNLSSVTYGGQAMTKIVDWGYFVTYNEYTAAFILDEAGIAAATSNVFVVTWGTAPAGATPAFSSVFLAGVNQSNLVGDTGTGGSTTTIAETTPLSTNDGDMVFVAGTCGNTGSYTPINGFTEAIELAPSSADGVCGYLSSTGGNVTPGVSHSNVNRQSVIGFVVQHAQPPPPLADFSGSPTSGISPLTVDFTDSSTGYIDSWAWDFGDGVGTSNLQNPSYTYTSAGTYTVTLTATGPGGSDDEIKTNYITVTEPPPVANFSGTPTSGYRPLLVQFTDTSTGTVSTWAWNFGDGVGTSNLQNPSYTYNNPGTYTVTLTVTGPGGTDDEIKTNYITVGEPAPVANFTGAPLTGAAPLAVTFTDTSTGTVSTWAWNFGDGVGTSNLQNPSYTYNNPGTYTVTLTVTGPGGTDDEIKTNYITVYAVPVANFSGTPTSGYRPLLVQFTDTSTGSVTSWSWDFGDGVGTSNLQNPSYTYTSAGTYTVTLTATGPGGTDDEIKTNYITVSEAPPVANFSGTPTSGYRPLLVQFTDQSSGTVRTWSWDFGDGVGTSDLPNPSYTYNAPGTYTVTLTVTGPGGSDDEIKTDYITVIEPPPVAAFIGNPLTGAVPLLVTFTDQSSGTISTWSWDFGDGVGTSNLQNPSYTYNNPGTYTVTLTVTGPGGTDDEIKTDYITVTVPPPVAAFIGTPLTGAVPLAVTFTDTSTGSITTWSWNFGDGVGTSNLQNPSYTYTSAGSYTVTLTATGPGGTDQEIKTNYIVVGDTLIIANFIANPTSGINPLLVQFADESAGTISTWSWDFGDGVGTSNLQNPSYTYNSIGTYSVSLTVTGPDGSDTETKTNYITVGEPPPDADFSANPTTGLKPLTVHFTDSSTGVITSWSWDFGDEGVSSTQNPSHLYTNAGLYTVTLTVTGPGGTDSEIKVGYITVNELQPVADFTASRTNGIKPFTVDFTDNSQNPVTSWSWDFGDGGTSTEQNPYHTYTSNGKYTVSLTVIGPGGTDAMQKVDYINVTDIVVDHSTRNVDSPQIATDGNGNVYAVWEDTRNGNKDIYFNYSSDYGFTYQSADIRLDTDASGANDSTVPQIACDDNGHVYVVWKDLRNGSPDIYFNYSSDYGVTWQSSDKKLGSIPYTPTPQSPRVACNNIGHVYVAWNNNLFNISSDYGATWLSQAKRISTVGGEETQLTCDQSGRIYVAWLSGTTDVLFNYSLDNGNTWQPSNRKISNSGALPYGISLTNDETGNVYCVWHDGRTNPDSPDIYFNSSSDYGNTWQVSDIKINTGTPGATYSIWPAIDSDEGGRVYVAWYDRRNSTGDIHLNYSSDYGVNWQVSDTRIDTDSPSADSGYPEIASDNIGHIYVIWIDDQDSIGPGLYMNYSLDYGVTWLSTNRKIGSGGLNPKMKTYGSRFYIIWDNNEDEDIIFNEVAPPDVQVPPFVPTDPYPENGASQVRLTPVLSWRAGDANLDDTLTYDVYFGDTSPPQIASPDQAQPTFVPLTPLEYFKTYYWQVVVKDNAGGITTGPIWSFNTMSGPPQFTGFSPADGAEDVGLNPTLSWTAFDPDPGDTLVYDVYFGQTSPPTQQTHDYTSNTYRPGLLSHATVYYWKIVARDNHGDETEGPILSFTTRNNPPQFANYTPSDGATGVSLAPQLRWNASDPDSGDTLTFDIYFGTESSPPLVASGITIDDYQPGVQDYMPGVLNHFTVYYWKVVAHDNHGGVTESPILSFTTMNSLPQFNDFSPPDNSTNISLTVTLSWSASDPDPGDTLTYDVYFGTVSSPPLVASDQTTATYQPGTLIPGTKYYWKVVARDNNGGETTLPAVSSLSFTTFNNPPQFLDFSPPHMSTGISLNPTLSWSASDPDVGDTLTYNIYFGKTSPPPLVLSNQTATTYQPVGLSSLKRYYWKIVAKDNHGATTSMQEVYFDTTSAPPVLSNFIPIDGAIDVPVNPSLKWKASDPDVGDTITYDVYLGTSPDPPLAASNLTKKVYKPTGLLPFTLHYWRVVARDNHGSESSSSEMTFTTGPPAPYISGVSSNPCQAGQVITITGERFGDIQGDSILRLNKTAFKSGSSKIILWSDTRIDFKIPAYNKWLSGTSQVKNLFVKVNGIPSNKIQLTIIKP